MIQNSQMEQRVQSPRKRQWLLIYTLSFNRFLDDKNAHENLVGCGEESVFAAISPF